ncbi:YadA family autotransporter adhesin [Dyella sp. 2RAB6]|uniref:YadA family autotransporter adhesin n=1 Tax=Dyella sp. 2RAB6 TaxID=3232992 RepID=UPI003F8FDC94
MNNVYSKSRNRSLHRVAGTLAALAASFALAQPADAQVVLTINNQKDGGCTQVYDSITSGSNLVVNTANAGQGDQTLCSTTAPNRISINGGAMVVGGDDTYAIAGAVGFRVLNNGAWITGNSNVTGQLRAGAGITNLSTSAANIFNSDYFRANSTGAAANAGAANSIALGNGAQALAASSTALGDSSTVAAAAGTGAIAGGHNSRVTGGTGAVALGEGQTANGNGAVAIGDPNSATGTGAIAVGANNTANGNGAVALGNTNSAQGQGAVAIGNTSNALAAGAVALGNAAAANNANDVALGSGSTTATAVGTASYTIAGTAYNFAGTTPVSTVSVGAGGAERTITNVAAGRINGGSTDAINGSQLFATNQAVDNLSSVVAAGATHYYSVNDGGTQGGNYANNGASGLNAIAAGVGATAAAASGTALGQNTGVSVQGGVALGSGAVSDRAIAPASGSITVGTNVIPYNTTDRNLLGAVSVGNATDFRQITNVADGTLDQDAVSLRQLKGAMSSFSVTPIKYFHANSTASDSLAAGAESVAVGPQTTVNGDNGVGIGNGAIVQQTAPGGTAIGQNATVNLADGVALGTNATSNGIQAMALGAGTQAAFAGSVALGAGSTTDAAVGTASTTLAGTTYNFAGATPGSTVSFGSVGAERTLTNLAAGRISGSSTDAINGSQLFATNQTLQQLYTSLQNLTSTVNNLPQQGPGNTVNTYQTSPDNTSNASATGSNSTAAGAGSTASGSNSTAVGAGSTASGNNSVAIGAGSVANTANSVSVGSPGNERTITNVAPGVNATDAATVGQVQDALTAAKNWSKNYTDQRFQSIDRDLNRIGNRANAGVASAIAMASLGQGYQPNMSTAGVGVGSFHGESSIAVGMSTISEAGRYIFKLSASTNSRGDAAVGGSANIAW